MPTILTMLETPCSIGIKRKGQVPEQIRIYPVAPTHPTVFYPSSKVGVSPELPQEIHWSVQGLGPGEQVLIEKKSISPSVFKWDANPVVLDQANPDFHSGPPIPLPGGMKQTRAWLYSITLKSPLLPAGRGSIVLDPSVIIEPDPK